MKFRSAFVSNSSASSFILDKRNERVQEILKQNAHIGIMNFDTRATGIIVGKAAYDDCEEHVIFESWSDQAGPLMEQMYSFALIVGVENLVCIRESDEHVGGFLEGTDWEELKKLSLFHMDWH